MKKLLPVIVLATIFISAAAQTNVTPSRYNFANQPEGTYLFDGISPNTWNTPPNWADPKDKYNNGYFVIAGGPDISGKTPQDPLVDVIQKGISIVDLGGEVGKVLALRGPSSNHKVGNAMGDLYSGQLFNLNFYGAPRAAGESVVRKKYRFRIVFSIAENIIRADASPLDKMYFVTYSGNPQGNLDANNNIFPSKFFALKDAMGRYVEDANENFIYDPTIWEVNEYDMTTDDIPFRLKIEITNMKDATLLIKEIQFIESPAGDPVQRQTLVIKPAKTGLSLYKNDNKAQLRHSVVGGKVTFYDLQPNEEISIFNVSGRLVSTIKAAESTETCVLNPGFYIVSTKAKVAKVLVK